MDARIWIDLGVGAATVGVGAATSLITGKINAARFTGAAEEKFVSIGNELRRLEQVDRDQWGAINATKAELAGQGEDIAEIRGAQRAKANGAGKPF